MQPIIVTYRREIATRVALTLGTIVVVAAVLLWMRPGEEPSADMASAVQIDPVPGAVPLAAVTTADSSAPTDRIDPGWAAAKAHATGIPIRALLAYSSADLTVDAEQPGCGIGWNTIAAIGSIESVHGSITGSQLGADGYPAPAIRGPALDGHGFAAVRDTDGGTWDGDAEWDRAVGPMQFIPSTWAKWGADGNGDGYADPDNIDDAALATARYLCASGSVVTPEAWRAAVFSYNHLDSYVDDVAAAANRYAAAG